MKTGDAFRANQAALEESLRQSATPEEAAAAIRTAFERTAALMAQEESDEVTRQRGQAVLAVAKESGTLLRSVRAEGKLVASMPDEEKKEKGSPKTMALYGGLGVMAVLAVYELINGRWIFALLAVIAVLLLYIGNGQAAGEQQKWKAEGTLRFEPEPIIRSMLSMCDAIDIAVQDLTIIDTEQTVRKMSGQEEALLDFVSALLEAKESGRADLVAESAAEAEQTLRRIGIQAIRYSPENGSMFDLLPTLGASRTVRPALVSGDRIVRRGVAAVRMQEVSR